MDSVRSFVGLWTGLALVILLYAFLDLGMNPQLLEEHNFSMQPDLTRAPELLHWGGRLLKEGAVGLLVSNAIVLGGIGALVVRGLYRLVRRNHEDDPERVPARVSFPPPG